MSIVLLVPSVLSRMLSDRKFVTDDDRIVEALGAALGVREAGGASIVAALALCVFPVWPCSGAVRSRLPLFHS